MFLLGKLQAKFTNYMKIALKNDSVDYFRAIKNSWNIEVLSIDNINNLEVFISQYSDIDTSFFLPNYLDEITDERLFIAIKNLTKKQQEIFLLYVDGISLNDIALRYQMAVGSVKATIFQIKDKLKKYMKGK